MEKKNQIPKYPHLRFPEFTDEWKEVKLGEVAHFSGGGTPSSEYSSYWEGTIPWISSSDIQNNNVTQINVTRFITKEALQHSSTKLCKAPCVLVVTRVGVGKVAYSDIDICTSQDFCILTDIQCEYHFLSYYLLTVMGKKVREVQGTSIKGITMQEVKSFHLCLPSLPEQRKIAALLSLIDERIEVQNAISNDLESLIVGFYNSVQYVTKAGWHKVRLRDLLTIRKEQNTSGSYEVYSVSVSRGIVNQIVHLRRSFAAANTSNYGVVHPGDLVYTKSPTGQFPFGIVKQNHNASPVAVSPLYGVYRPISPEIGTLLHYFFLSPLRANNYLAPLIQKGAKNTINIRTDHFLDNVVLLPKDEKELRCIVDCLLALDERLSVEREYAEQLKQQKAYLLRQMFI